MSHVATVTLNICAKDEILALNEIKKEVENFKEIGNKNFSNYFNESILDLQSSIEEAKDRIKEIEGFHDVSEYEVKKLEQKYYLELDNIIKRMENLKMNLNIEDEISFLINSSNQNLSNIISEHGYIASVAIRHIMSNNSSLSKEIILQEIDRLRFEEAEKNRSEIYIKKIKEELNKSSLPKEIVQDLYVDIKSATRNVDIMDYSALVKSIEINFLKTNNLIKDTVEELKKMGFKLISKNIKIFKNNNEVEKIYKISIVAKNNSNNNIEINFGINGTLEYKMGNYKEHLCEKDADKLISGLESKGRKNIQRKITRTTSISRPQLRQLKQKERNK